MLFEGILVLHLGLKTASSSLLFALILYLESSRYLPSKIVDDLCLNKLLLFDYMLVSFGNYGNSDSVLSTWLTTTIYVSVCNCLILLKDCLSYVGSVVYVDILFVGCTFNVIYK